MLKILLFIFVSFLSLEIHANSCENYTNDGIFSSEPYNNLINKFANKDSVATEADYIFSSLMKSKSSILLNWIKNKNFNQKTPKEVITRKWRDYYFKNFIINRYPHKSEDINLIVEQLFTDLNSNYFPNVTKVRFSSFFLQAKNNAINFINKSNIDAKTKEEINQRIASIKIYWFTNLKNSKYSSRPQEFLNWGIAYDPVENQINIGLEATKYKSDETILAVFAHEIGHSIDPCRWNAYMKSKNPFLRVMKCLRTKNSVAAKPRDDKLLDKLTTEGKISKDLALGLRMNPTCNKINYPPHGFQKDQLPEVFADWFSAEVVAESGKDFLNHNLRSDLCIPSNNMPGSSYVSNKMRREGIYFTQPEIQKRLGLTSKFKYCSLDKSN